jgi:hypothetical protein
MRKGFLGTGCPQSIYTLICGRVGDEFLWVRIP